MKGYKVAKREFNRICKDLGTIERYSDFFKKGCLEPWYLMEKWYVRKDQKESIYFDMRAFEYDDKGSDDYFRMCCRFLKEGYQDTDRGFEIDVPYGFMRKDGKGKKDDDSWVAILYPFFFHNSRTHENTLGHYDEIVMVHSKDKRPYEAYQFKDAKMASRLFGLVRKYLDWSHLSYVMYERYRTWEIDPDDPHLMDPLSNRHLLDDIKYKAYRLRRNIEWNFGDDSAWDLGDHDISDVISRLENDDHTVTPDDLLHPRVRFGSLMFECVCAIEKDGCKVVRYEMYQDISISTMDREWIKVCDFEDEDDLLDYIITRYPERLNDEQKVRQAKRWERAIEAYNSVMDKEEEKE